MLQTTKFKMNYPFLSLSLSLSQFQARKEKAIWVDEVRSWELIRRQGKKFLTKHEISVFQGIHSFILLCFVFLILPTNLLFLNLVFLHSMFVFLWILQYFLHFCFTNLEIELDLILMLFRKFWISSITL